MLTVAELSRDRIERLVASARTYRTGQGRRHPDALVGLCFFEESLRTRVGFEAAAARLGARTTTVEAVRDGARMASPESLDDALRSIGEWCDALCLRSADAAAPQRIAALVSTPVINCGNGSDEHPTQALVDLFAIYELLGRLDGLRVAVVGDLDGMRTAHSLLAALSQFADLSVRCIAPYGLELPRRCAHVVREAGHVLVEQAALDLHDVDVLYVAGLPSRTRVGTLTAEQHAAYRVTAAVAAVLAPDALVLCPLPRVDEIAPEVDTLPQAAYFRQSALGIAMRMAILDEALAGDR